MAWLRRRSPSNSARARAGAIGASRARTRADVYRLGRLERSDWRPVGGGGIKCIPGLAAKPFSSYGTETNEEEATESDATSVDIDDEGTSYSGSGLAEESERARRLGRLRPPRLRPFLEFHHLTTKLRRRAKKMHGVVEQWQG